MMRKAVALSIHHHHQFITIIIINTIINIMIKFISLVWCGGPGSDPDRHLALLQEVSMHLDASTLGAVLDGVVLADALRAVDVIRLHP